MQRLCWIGTITLLLAGCATSPPSDSTIPPAIAPAESGMIITPTSEISGRVSLANMQGRYVVLSFPIGALPEPGRQMSLYRNGLKVADIRISGPHRDYNTVADVLAGEARVGDEVR